MGIKPLDSRQLASQLPRSLADKQAHYSLAPPDKSYEMAAIDCIAFHFNYRHLHLLRSRFPSETNNRTTEIGQEPFQLVVSYLIALTFQTSFTIVYTLDRREGTTAEKCWDKEESKQHVCLSRQRGFLTMIPFSIDIDSSNSSQSFPISRRRRVDYLFSEMPANKPAYKLLFS